jgi:hypothetical protein
MIRELVELLTSGELADDQVEAIAMIVEDAPDNPEYEWREWLPEPTNAMLWALLVELDDFIATSDKIDELHEQIQEFFDDEFPGFPHDPRGKQPDGVQTYFQWLDGVLQARAVDRGGYELLEIENPVDDNMCAIIVYRPDTDRILQLADALSLRIRRTTAR